MEVYDLGLVRPSVLLTSVVTTTIKVVKKKVLKCLWESKVMDIGLLRPANQTQVIVELVVVGQV